MKVALTGEERSKLERLHREQRDSKEADRIKAVLLLDMGYSRAEVAKILFRDEGTITAWRDSFQNRQNLTDWLKDNCSGYQGRLNDEQLQAVEAFVEAHLILDARQVRAWILEQYDIEYGISGIHALLHRLGFRYKDLTSYPSKMNPAEQSDFNAFYEDLLENLPEGSVLGFLDGVHPEQNTKPTQAWIKEGEQKWIPSNTGRKRLNINGFYDPLNQEGGFLEEKTLNTESTITFLKTVEKRYPTASSIYMICDNAPYYYNEEVQAYLQNSRIELIFLPTYSPNLNLIERLWKFLRAKVINTHYYEKFKDFKEAVMGFLQNITDHKADLKQFIGLKLHLFNPFQTEKGNLILR
jgi:transposase